MDTGNIPPGWHADPNLPEGTLRWWDGSRWTEQLRSAPPVPQPPAAAGRAAPNASLVDRNSTSFTAIAVVIGYLVLASVTGIVLLGILPAMLSMRAYRRRARLAPLAIGAAAIAIVFSVSVLTRH